MSKKKSAMRSNRKKEIVMKCVLLFGDILLFVGMIATLVLFCYNLKSFSLYVAFGSLGIGIISILVIIIIAGTLKNDGSDGFYNGKNLKIMHYSCELEEDLKDRLSVIFVEEEKSDHMFSIMNAP